VVPRDSALLYDRAERDETIEANHVEITKFRDREDPGFKKVSSAIRTIVEDIKAQLEEERRNARLEEERRKLQLEAEQRKVQLEEEWRKTQSEEEKKSTNKR
jgi:hypothetical protein